MTRTLLLLAAFPALALCQKISLAFDETLNFSEYKTFAIAAGKLNSKNPSVNNELVQKQIEGDIRRKLTERGLTEVPGQPDLNVRYSLGSGQRVEDEDPDGWRGTRIVRRHYAEGTSILDLRDAKKHVLVWRAVAVVDETDPFEIQDRLDDMVRKAAEKYPPKKQRRNRSTFLKEVFYENPPFCSGAYQRDSRGTRPAARRGTGGQTGSDRAAAHRLAVSANG